MVAPTRNPRDKEEILVSDNSGLGGVSREFKRFRGDISICYRKEVHTDYSKETSWAYWRFTKDEEWRRGPVTEKNETDLQTTEEIETMKLDIKTLMMFQMMNQQQGEGQSNPLGGIMPLLLLGGDKGIKLDKVLLMNAIPGLTENERQSLAEGNTEAAITSFLAREMSSGDNPLAGLLPLLLLGDD